MLREYYGQVPGPFFFELVRRDRQFDMAKNHFHPVHEIYYLVAGERIYHIEGNTYHIRQGDLVFIPKDHIHKTSDCGVSEHERIVIHLTDQEISRMHPEHPDLLTLPFRQETPVLRLPKQRLLYVESLFDRAVEELRQQQSGYDIVLKNTVFEILLLAARTIRNRESVYAQRTNAMHRKIEEIARYVNGQYCESLSLSGLSSRFFISPTYLSRLFRDVTGFTLVDYIHIIRIKEAQRMLRDTSLRISDIAGKVGFENFSHFGKTFKMVTGMSPRTYRETLRDRLV